VALDGVVRADLFDAGERVGARKEHRPDPGDAKRRRLAAQERDERSLGKEPVGESSRKRPRHW
jgi:hypothetical protein